MSLNQTEVGGARIMLGDCLESLRRFPDSTFNTCVTSPPYFGLRDYGQAGQLGLEETPDEFVAALVAVMREVRRTLTDDGTLWLNLGDSYAGSWGAQSRGGSASEASSNLEGSSMLEARRIGCYPLGGSGTGSLKKTPGLKGKDLIGIPWRVAFALQADGWYLRQDIIWHKPNPMPESVRDRCTKAHEYIFLLSKSPRYHFDSDAIKEAAAKGAAGSTFHGGKTGAHQLGRSSTAERAEDGRRNRRSVWTVTTKPYKGAHFATFPPDLIEPCILAGCPADGAVLDPFGGAGTTGLVANALRRRSVLLELNPEYCELAANRLRAAWLSEQSQERMQFGGAA